MTRARLHRAAPFTQVLFFQFAFRQFYFDAFFAQKMEDLRTQLGVDLGTGLLA